MGKLTPIKHGVLVYVLLNAVCHAAQAHRVANQVSPACPEVSHFVSQVYCQISQRLQGLQEAHNDESAGSSFCFYWRVCS